jgi:hypothetical protein
LESIPGQPLTTLIILLHTVLSKIYLRRKIPVINRRRMKSIYKESMHRIQWVTGKIKRKK